MIVNQALEENGTDRVYLSGPIRHLDDHGEGWREEWVEEYGDEFGYFNPLDEFGPETHEILHDPIDYDPDAEKEQVMPNEYVTSDKVGIAESDYMFVALPEVISTGTKMEAMWGYCQCNIPIFVWAMDDQKISGWLYDHSEIIHEDQEMVMEEIRNYE